MNDSPSLYNDRMLDILENVLEELHDGVTITDSQGRILRVGDSCEKLYGIGRDYQGRSVSDLEREGVFSPSLTLIALREKKKVAMMQPDRYGHELLVTASPIVDPVTSEILYVVSYASWDSSNLSDLEAQYQKLQKEIARNNHELEAFRLDTRVADLISLSPKMQQVISYAQKFAPMDVDLLITGETGTGKSHLAKYLHSISPRKEGPLCLMSCEAFSAEILDSELFGYSTINPYTGEAVEKLGLVEIADGGTLILENIECLSREAQGSLLHLLKNRQYYKKNGKEAKKVDLRLIATSSTGLEELKSHLLERLYYHMTVAHQLMPTLQERKEDIPELIQQYLDHYNSLYDKAIGIGGQALEILTLHPWTGNIIELKHVIQKLVLTLEDDVIQPHHLPDEISPYAASSFAPGIDLKEYLEYYEGRMVMQAYEKCGSTVKLAKYLGISQATAVRKLQKYGGSLDSDGVFKNK